MKKSNTLTTAVNRQDNLNQRGTQPAPSTPNEALTLVASSQRLMEEWRACINDVAQSRGLHLPQGYVTYILKQALENITILQLPPQQQDDTVGEVVNEAFVDYLVLLARTMERVKLEMPAAVALPTLPAMLVDAVYEAVNQCESALYCPPLGMDMFVDVLWPAAKQRLESCVGSGCKVDDYFHRRCLEELG